MKKQYLSSEDFLKQERFESEEEEKEEEKEQITMSESDIVKRFKERFKLMQSHWNPIYEEMQEDWNIYRLEQWTEQAKAIRKSRPQVTCDISRKFVKSVVGNTFANPPGVKLTARTNGASEKAIAISDAVRYFEDKSGAIYAYTHAQECSAVAGIGWIKISYEIDEQENLPAVICIEKKIDPLSVLIDPDSVELDGSDMIDAVEIHEVSHRAKNGKEHDGKFTYWWIQENGKVCWAIIENEKIEAKGVFAGINIPLIPVYGEYSLIGGELKIFGIIRQLRDIQRSFNYVLSEGVERIALTPKSPITAYEGSIPDAYLPDWIKSVTEPVPILFHAQKDNSGNPLPPPARNNTSPDVEWIPQMLSQLLANAKETTGIYDAGLGNIVSENMSGVAVKATAANGDRGQLVYSEHLQIAVKMVGRIVLSLLEPVLGDFGILPTLSEDGSTKIRTVYGASEDSRDVSIPDLDVSDLDISISSAPAYATRKADGIDQIQKLIAIKPDLAGSVMDLVVRNMDFPGSKEIADRLSLLLPPELKGENNANPQFAAQQISEMSNQIAQLQEQLTKVSQDNANLTMQLNQNTQAMIQVANIKEIGADRRKQMDANLQIAKEQIKESGENYRTEQKILADMRKENAQISLN